MTVTAQLFHATRQIRAWPRRTQARTTYYDIAAPDADYVYTWLMTFLCDMTELATHDPAWAREWLAADRSLPRGRNGANSLASMCAGIAGARIANSQQNLSESQLSAVEEIFARLVPLYEAVERGPDLVEFARQQGSLT